MNKYLNPKFFGTDDEMLPKFHKNLMTASIDILDDLMTQLGDGIDDDFLTGITLTGSMLTSSYDKFSDLDLHFVVDHKYLEQSNYLGMFLKLFAKDFNSNEFTIFGAPLEIYFQDSEEPHSALSLYNILDEEWILAPNKETIEYTDYIKNLSADFIVDITNFDAEADLDADIDKLDGQIKIGLSILAGISDFRKQAKLKYGDGDAFDFVASDENLTFKWLRRTGMIEKLKSTLRDLKEARFNQ